MIRLLNAGFARLKKNKIFWVLTAFSIVLALFMIFMQYSDMIKYGNTVEIEQLILNYSTMIGIVIAIFTSLFLGVEYSDGTIRNKICIGHKRINIYLSNLIIVISVSLFLYILFLLVILMFGIPLFGLFTISIVRLVMLLGCVIGLIVAYCAIFTFIVMILSNKTISAVVSILLGFGLLMFALMCLNVLNTSEYIQVATMLDGNTKIEEKPNPKYPSETKKKVVQTLLDINPAGQAYQLSGRAYAHLKILLLYSFGIIIIFTSIGLLIFEKKELK